METKISATGWLCAKDSKYKWHVICQLTPEQINEYQAVQMMVDNKHKKPWRPETDPLDQGDNLGESPDY